MLHEFNLQIDKVYVNLPSYHFSSFTVQWFKKWSWQLSTWLHHTQNNKIQIIVNMNKMEHIKTIFKMDNIFFKIMDWDEMEIKMKIIIDM
jgi:hypothetical protein